jgi:hypothetical protein
MAQGIISPSAGPINSATADALTAAPIDFGGSYWNPAIISGLSSQEYLLGSALILPDIQLQSAIRARSILGQFPATTRSGSAVGHETGTQLVPILVAIRCVALAFTSGRRDGIVAGVFLRADEDADILRRWS